MALPIGSRIGAFEITGTLGAGGMGEVYRARDTRLSRDVALKILPELFAADSDRLSRFQREAQILASLNHPNIAAIHGLEEGPPEGGPPVHALVLELVEGPTLADRILNGPLSFEGGLSVARQIAEALEAAHTHGIVHRDLKPSNIKVRDDGLVKVLDFGLAKTLDPRAASGESSLSPTMTSPAMTRAGVIIGTAAYMSPEQARGLIVDSRADIWAFGVVLYEMFTGGTLFDAPTVSDTIAAVLRADIDWRRLPADLPDGIRRLTQRCLQRDPKQRLQHIGDARIEIEDLQRGRSEQVVTSTPSHRWRLALLSAAIAAVVVGPLAWLLKPQLPAPSSAPLRFAVRTPYDLAGARMSPLDISPDGRQLVYAAVMKGKLQLVQQSFDAFVPHLVEGAEGAWNPVISPKGDAVGFWVQQAGQLRQVSLTGGAPTRVIDGIVTTGSSWGDDGTLVISPGWGEVLQVMRPGTSRIENLTKMNLAGSEGAHLYPQVLPGGHSVLFTIWTGAPTWDEAEIAIADLASGEHSIVMRGAAFGRYATSGHLIFWRGNSLFAAPFDLDARKVTGESVRVVQNVRLDNFSGAAHFAVSRNGTLAYVSGGADTFTESYVADRVGRVTARLDEDTPSGGLAFSPDGLRVAGMLFTGGTFGLGVYDLKRHLLTRLPVTGDTANATWSANGDRLVFLSNATGEYMHYSIPYDGSGHAETLLPGSQPFTSSQPDWSRDGRHFVYVKFGAKTGEDIWVYTPGARNTPTSLLAAPANESCPTLSPDGRFIAYQSDESGTTQIYVRPFPNVNARREQISRSGGRNPKWSRDGTEILYVSENGIMRAAVGKSGASALLFGDPSLALALSGLVSFDVSPDGRSLAIERTPVEKAPKEINVVLNWFDELRRLVPRN